MEAKFDEFKSKPGGMTSKDCSKWFKDAGCLGKALTSQSLDIAYSAVKGKDPLLKKEKLDALLEKVAGDYAKDKKCSKEEAIAQMKEKLGSATVQLKGTGTSKSGGVDRMTDTSKYTGAHKERFDKDGKGKGAEGRTDKVDNTGYVGNYKGKDTYGKK